MKDEKELFVTGFNNGYLLAKHRPELLKLVDQHFDDPGNDYFQGMLAGKQEYEIEKAKDFFKKFDKGDKEKDRTKDKDKDDKEIKR